MVAENHGDDGGRRSVTWDTAGCSRKATGRRETTTTTFARSVGMFGVERSFFSVGCWWWCCWCWCLLLLLLSRAQKNRNESAAAAATKDRNGVYATKKRGEGEGGKSSKVFVGSFF